MGYESDQFYRPNSHDDGETLVNVTDSGHGVKIVPTQNSPFSYPDNTIRGGYKPYQYALNEGTGLDEAVIGTGVNYDLGTLKKGYIRNLQVDPGQRITKCHFQFNPTTLNQSVSQNSQILNFLQQNMAQYAQPMPSNVNFQFQLMFDRSKELNNYNGAVEQGLDTGALWAKTDPSVVGVLHDIGTLYEAIGVGLSDSQQEYMLSTLEDQIKAELLQESQEGATDLQTDTDVSEAIAERRDQASKLLDINRGNTGFLLPIPVRVVFSSLYIVEGLVQNVSVRYVKFTRNLVPMQATVEITLEGKYIGFAKKDTFFSAVLDERRRLKAEEIAAQNKVTIQNGELREIGEQDFPEIGVALFGTDTIGQDNDKMYSMLSQNDNPAWNRTARVRVYPNLNGMIGVRQYWSTDKPLTVAFSGEVKSYRIHKDFIARDQQGGALFKSLEDSFEDAADETNDQRDSRYQKALQVAEYIETFSDETRDSLAALSSGTTQADVDELAGYGKVVNDGLVVFYSAVRTRTDKLRAEEGRTSFNDREQIESLNDDDSFIANEDAKTGESGGETLSEDKSGGNDYNKSLSNNTYNSLLINNAINWFIVYDIKITITGEDGSQAVGYARDYKYEANHTYTLAQYGDYHTTKYIQVDWSGGN